MNPELIRRPIGIPLLGSFMAGLPLLRTDIYSSVRSWKSPEFGKQPDKQLQIVELLLHNGASPNERFEGYTIWQYWVHYLHSLCKERHYQHQAAYKRITKLMLSYNVDLDISCIRDYNPTSSAAGNRWHNIAYHMETFEKGPSRSIQDPRSLNSCSLNHPIEQYQEEAMYWEYSTCDGPAARAMMRHHPKRFFAPGGPEKPSNSTQNEGNIDFQEIHSLTQVIRDYSGDFRNDNDDDNESENSEVRAGETRNEEDADMVSELLDLIESLKAAKKTQGPQSVTS